MTPIIPIHPITVPGYCLSYCALGEAPYRSIYIAQWHTSFRQIQWTACKAKIHTLAWTLYSTFSLN
jgi:hypothetical protein